MKFELHYDLISGCTLNFFGGAIVVFFLDWGCKCSVAPPGYGPDQRLLQPYYHCNRFFVCLSS